jgi:hypothetical protein
MTHKLAAVFIIFSLLARRFNEKYQKKFVPSCSSRHWQTAESVNVSKKKKAESARLKRTCRLRTSM